MIRPSPPRRPPSGPRVRSAIFQLHWILGITLGLVLAIMGVTGATMAFEDPIMEALSPGVVDVVARPAALLTPDQLLTRFAGQRPGAQPTSLTLRTAVGASPQITFTEAPGKGARKLYLDPYDGHILGRATGEAFFATVRRLHRFLLLPGDANGPGRQITGAAAFSLVFFAVSGIYLRWPRRPQGWRFWLKPNLRLRRRGLYWSLHTVIGTWLALLYLAIALTGLTWSYDWYKTGFTRLLTGTAAEDGTESAKREKGARAVPFVPLLDAAWKATEREPGGVSLAVLSVPKSSPAPIRVRYLSLAPSNERAFNELRIERGTGTILKREIYADRPLGERIVSARLAVHRGSYLGLPGAILFMAAALAMPLFPLTGWLLYLGRRRQKTGRRRRLAAAEAT